VLFRSEIFGSKKFSDLLKDIYDNQKKKDRQINLLIADLKPMLNNISDAAILVPAIKDFIEVSVKNDEHLVKLAAVIQRAMSNKGEETSSFLTDEEKEALLKGIQEIQEEQEDNNIGNGSTKNIDEWDGIRDSSGRSGKS
jgi:tRNA U34 5-carboxymethylaminomethyl modifying GTPase MnmE/TrmE